MKYIKLDTKKSGFLLAEAMMSLFVTLLILLILSQVIAVIKNVETSANSGYIRGQVTYDKIQNLLEGSQLKVKNSHRIIFRPRENGGFSKNSFVIEEYISNQKMIRYRSTTHGGHVPLVTDIEDCQFSLNGDVLKIEIIDKEHKKSEWYITNNHENFPEFIPTA
ncbi:ComGF family competence protein [Companilactobacillus metriopterae]|uniref:ComGF family competence protein n=1 Tax=Companilactobacillus metriopterae TaxID=1909267 RepID=UPI00100AB82F|nr:ComGF family competence protein [Companilactobacillus metriopterae]